MTIRVLVNGASGKMGQATVQAIRNEPELVLVGQPTKEDGLLRAIKDADAQVVVDFTTAAVAFKNANTIIDAGVHPVIGTSGLSADHIKALTLRCAEKKLGGVIAPNFSIGAILMMRYAQDCARYFPHVEIIELHHDQKLDAPSATAIKTAEMIAAVRSKIAINAAQKEMLPGARGASYEDIRMHSVRLPGLVAHQAVIFGEVGQTLTIRHDTINREAFMPGVCLACRKVLEIDSLVYGLEHFL
jgi:4-hydroxy-tetrahydrodipicolinate reductase